MVNDIKFNSDNLKTVIDSFIIDTNIYPINGYNSILGYLSLSGSDTILILRNTPPYEKEDLVFRGKYKNYDLYFYSPLQLERKLENLIVYDKTILNNKILELQSNEIDMVYEASYIINGDDIRKEKIPLEWSTDSIK